jgi:hypothetical protein
MHSGDSTPRPDDFSSVANTRRRSRSLKRGNRSAKRACTAWNSPVGVPASAPLVNPRRRPSRWDALDIQVVPSVVTGRSGVPHLVEPEREKDDTVLGEHGACAVHAG